MHASHVLMDLIPVVELCIVILTLNRPTVNNCLYRNVSDARAEGRVGEWSKLSRNCSNTNPKEVGKFSTFFWSKYGSKPDRFLLTNECCRMFEQSHGENAQALVNQYYLQHLQQAGLLQLQKIFTTSKTTNHSKLKAHMQMILMHPMLIVAV